MSQRALAVFKRSRRTSGGAVPPVPTVLALLTRGLRRREALLHAVGSSRRCGVVIALESGELPVPERPHVCLMTDKRTAGVPNRCLGVHQGYHLVVLGDELSWLERRVLASRCKTTEPA